MLFWAGLGALAVQSAMAAETQAWPTRPVRVVVGYPPGGPTDLISRVVAQRLTESTRQQFVVDNRGGANGIIGTEIAARSQPDGYTLLFGTSSVASNGSLYRKMPYDAAKDLLPIFLTANTPYYLVANAGVAAATVPELITLARGKPGEIHFGSAGNGSGTHLAGEQFNLLAGVKLVHVPFKGTGPSVTELVAGRIQLMFVGLPAVIQHVKGGRLKLLAIAEPKRSPQMPELPTVEEGGLPGFQFSAWFAFFGPAGLPPALRRHISNEVAAVMRTKDLQDRIVGLGAVPLSSTPEQFDAYFRDEIARYAKIVKAAGVALN